MTDTIQVSEYKELVLEGDAIINMTELFPIDEHYNKRVFKDKDIALKKLRQMIHEHYGFMTEIESYKIISYDTLILNIKILRFNHKFEKEKNEKS